MRRVAVVGCGYWGRNLVRNFDYLGALEVVCDNRPEVWEWVADNYPAARVAGDFTVVLDDDRIDAVVISTPASTHYELTKQALAAGKDVFVEKPLAMRVARGRELVEMADELGAVLMVGHVLRYHPAVTRLRELIDSGELGRLHYVYSNRLNLGKVRTEENILWSFAPHDISTIMYLLGESPQLIAAQGGTYLTEGVLDVTVTTMEFEQGVRGHIFVSWLHPYKEHKLIVVGQRGMAVFRDSPPKTKLLRFDHSVEWVNRVPVPSRADEAEEIPIDDEEPLRAECRHFLDCLESRESPRTDGREGLQVLEVLEACQESMDRGGRQIAVSSAPSNHFVHPTAVIDEPAEIRSGTRIWHFSHVMSNARIGRDCTLGQNVFVASDVVIGNNVKIQNNVSLYTGVVLEDDVFCGPSMVFTNVVNPRSHVPRKDEYRETLVRRGASLGANCTIVCGNTIGRYAFIGAGAVVTDDVPDYALMVGIPAQLCGWMCECGVRLEFAETPDPAAENTAECVSCGAGYVKIGDNVTQTAPMRSSDVAVRVRSLSRRS